MTTLEQQQLRDQLLNEELEIEKLKAQLETRTAQFKAELADHLREFGSFQVGPWKYALVKDKKLKAVSPELIYQAVARAAGGDEATIISTLSANAFKPAAVRKTIDDPAQYDLLYVETVDEKAEKKPAKINTEFAK